MFSMFLGLISGVKLYWAKHMYTVYHYVLTLDVPTDQNQREHQTSLQCLLFVVSFTVPHTAIAAHPSFYEFPISSRKLLPIPFLMFWCVF